MGDLARQVQETADAERRHLERALHDGAQQRLAALSATLAVARRRLDAGEEGGLELLGQVSDETQRCLDDLRDLARKIYPAALDARGLAVALRDLAFRAEVPVEVTMAPEERLAEHVELAAYIVVSDALAHATRPVQVSARVVEGQLLVEVRGAAPGTPELDGLRGRLEALGGRLEASSPSDGEPYLRATIPL
jgi:signal transduction histidine kinase